MNDARKFTIGGVAVMLEDEQCRQDLAALSEEGGAVATLNQKVAALEALIESDSDGAINKFNEITDFLNGLSNEEATTLQSLLQGKANLHHTHAKEDITDFDHSHDARYYTKTEVDSAMDTEQNSINAINEKIPSTASADNKLVDTAAMNRAITRFEADFKGTFDTIEEIQELENVSTNDYVYLRTEDASGNHYFDRYIYTSSNEWAYEYRLDNNSFSAEEWAAIDSGMTGAKTEKLDALPTNEQLQQALDTYYKKQDGVALETAVNGLGKRVNTLEAIVPVMNDALPTTYTLEQNTNPEFSLVNSGAAERYVSAMGGYLWYKKNGQWYAAKLNSSSWNKFADGTPVTAAIENVCETIIKTPDCHFLGNGQTMTFGGLQPVAGGHKFEAPRWNGAYLASVGSDNKLHSRPNTTPAHSRTMSSFWSLAQALDSNAGLSNYQFHCLINALYQARYGNLNSQAKIGAGWQHSNWEYCRDVVMGLTRSLGDGSGKVLYNDATVGDQYPTKLFGFEDMWGKLLEFRPGIRFYMDGDVRKAVVYDGNQVSNTAEGRELTGLLQSANGTYTTSMELGEYWDMIPKTVGGSDTTNYCDGYWAATEGELLLVGGDAYGSAQCGLSYSSSGDGFSGSAARVGARLAFYADPEIVSGAELVAMIS